MKAMPKVKTVVTGMSADEILAYSGRALTDTSPEADLNAPAAAAQEIMDECLDRISKLQFVTAFTRDYEEVSHLMAIVEEHRKIASGLARLIWPVVA